MENSNMRLCWKSRSNGSDCNLAKKTVISTTVLKARCFWFDSRCRRDVELKGFLQFAKIWGELGEDIRTGMPLSSVFSDALLHMLPLYAMLFLNSKNTKNKKSARWIGWSGAFLFWKRWSWSWNFCSSSACGRQQCYTALKVSITIFVIGNNSHS